jgi:hypothetical protein
MDAVEFKVTIKLLHKETGKGLKDLLVVLLDLENFRDPESAPAGDLDIHFSGISGAISGGPSQLNDIIRYSDRLFSGISDSEGKVSAVITPRDFNTGKKSETKPDLLLLVLSPEEPGLDVSKRLLYLSNDLRVNAGSNEAYIVNIGTALLREKELPIPDTKSEIENKILSYRNEVSEGDQLNNAIYEAENAKIRSRQTQHEAFKEQFKNLITPLPVNAIGTGFSTFVDENEKVGDKIDQHFKTESGKRVLEIQKHVNENKGVEVRFVQKRKGYPWIRS